MTVVVFLLLDVVTKVVGQAYGSADVGPLRLLPATQSLLVTAAAAATMWSRPRLAVALTAVVVALAFSAGPCGTELWLVVVIGVTAAARGSRRQVALVALGQVGYAVCFGALLERRHAGWGWGVSLTILALAAVGLTVGSLARRLLQARDQRRARVRRLEREQAEIRGIERARLADELQTIVSQGLATIGDELHGVDGLDGVVRQTADPDTLRSALSRIDGHSRSLLTQMRALLEVLRRDRGDAGLGSAPRPATGWRRQVSGARAGRIAATGVCLLLAVRAPWAGDGLPAAQGWVQLVGLLACALALWFPAAAVVAAALALALSVALRADGYSDAVATTLLLVIATGAAAPRRFWLAVAAVGVYGGLLAVTDASDPAAHIVLIYLSGFLAVAAGLTVRHFVTARRTSQRQLVDLTEERAQVESEERTSVARELHDVVAHSLSVTTMLVMATSNSVDPRRLITTLDQVRSCTETAQHELATLVGIMCSPRDESPATPLGTPLASARALAGQLADHGHHLVLDIDPAANALDVTTQRTLSRIMQEAATNILRYAPTGLPCHCALAVGDTGVRLSVASPMASSDRTADLSLGWGLRGIRERVELTAGTFSAGPQGGRWLVDVTLPAPTAATDALTGAPEQTPVALVS